MWPSAANLTKLEQLFFTTISFHIKIIDSVLTYKLHNSANLTNAQKQLVKATESKMEYLFTNTTNYKKEDFKTKLN